MNTGEPFAEKFVRKIKENPFVPIGALATTGAMAVAMVQMRRGNRDKLNTWLRMRVILQTLTIAALMGGSWAMHLKRKETVEDEQRRIKSEQGVQAKLAFEERLRAAEEIYRAEVADEAERGKEKSSTGWWSSLGFSPNASIKTVEKPSNSTSPPPTSPVQSMDNSVSANAEPMQSSRSRNWWYWGTSKS